MAVNSEKGEKPFCGCGSRALMFALITSAIRWKGSVAFQPSTTGKTTTIVSTRNMFSFHTGNERRRRFSLSSSSSAVDATTSGSNNISENDIDQMNLALEYAKRGFGHTFPNPAVGCVLVRQDTNEVIGAGFHPRAGFPHAEVFALLEATGHVTSGTEAAESVVVGYSSNNNNVKRTRKQRQQQKDSDSSSFSDDDQDQTLDLVKQLTKQYASDNGPQELLDGRSFEDIPVTAYVTLEPCCHYGKTPPCAASLAQAKVSRVVVGFRDPNPRVDGGGVTLLREAGVQVDMMSTSSEDDDNNEAVQQAHEDCANIVTDFVKRITPKQQENFDYVTGAMRRSIRAHAGRMKNENSLAEVEWTGASITPPPSSEVDDNGEVETDWEGLVQDLSIDPSWLERTDHLLWENELILLRLTKAAKKKKAVKILGELIANHLQAHVAQTVGHTVLLYRPGIPPKLTF